MKLLTEERFRAQSMIDFGPRREQVLGKMMLGGFESLTEAEKIEFYLHKCRPKKGTDVQAISVLLLETFGGIADVIFLTEKQLLQAEGMYPALARRFTNVGRLVKAWAKYEQVYRKVYIRNIVELCRYVLPLYRRSEYPGTWQLCLNEAFELVYENEIVPSRAWGEDDAVENSLLDAEFVHAKYVIIVQMCGRELANPKPYDKKHARLHAERLREAGFVLLDVVLVDEGKITSMYELGMVKPFGKRINDRQNYLKGKDEPQ